MTKPKKILTVVQDKPGSTGYQIQCELEKQSLQNGSVKVRFSAR